MNYKVSQRKLFLTSFFVFPSRVNIKKIVSFFFECLLLVIKDLFESERKSKMEERLIDKQKLSDAQNSYDVL